jgi:hypothetical protein
VTTRVALSEMLSTEIAALDAARREANKASELGPRLETIPSVGPVIASAFRARVTEAPVSGRKEIRTKKAQSCCRLVLE